MISLKNNKESKNQQIQLSLNCQEIKLDDCLDTKAEQVNINELSDNSFFLNFKTREEEEVPFNPIPEIQYEHEILLDCILNLFEQINKHFDQFFHPFYLKLISRFMMLSKELAKVLNMETINIKTKGSRYLLIHPNNTELYTFYFNFHYKIQKMHDKGFLREIDQQFIDFYNWIEDVKRQVYLDGEIFDPQKLPPTHTLAKQLQEILNQNESERQPQKKQKIEDDIESYIIRSLENTMWCAIDFTVKMEGDNSIESMTREEQEGLYQQIIKIYENQKVLNELIEKLNQTNPEKASHYKNFRDFIFILTYVTPRIEYYIKRQNIKKQLNIDFKENIKYQNEYPYPEGFFEQLRSNLEEFIQKAKLHNISE